MIKNVGVWLGSLFLIGSGIMFWKSLSLSYYSDLGPGPGLFPRWLTIALMALSVLYIIGSLRGEKILWPKVMPKGRDLGNVGLVLVAVVLFIALFETAGFIISGTLMLVILLARSYKWYLALLISAAASVLLFVAFSYGLDVPLPGGTISDWIGG
jgi:putative tricarboxylic transport membrane protein